LTGSTVGSVLLPGGGPKLHLWRAQHRNDDGWAARGWNSAGLQSLTTTLLDFHYEKGSHGESVVSSSIRYVGKGGYSALHLARYTIYPDGTIAVDNAVSPFGPNVTLARMGVRMLLGRNLNKLSYFARGPMENYADRKRGSDVGRYSSTVDGQLTPYPKPQECGNHEDMKWLSLSAAGASPLVAMADQEPLQFSALPYTDEEMEDVPYSVDLPKSKATVLILSSKTLGVGSNACGPRPLPEYRLDSSPRSFSYALYVGRAKDQIKVPKREGQPVLVQRLTDGATSLQSKDPIQVSLDGQRWMDYNSPIRVGQPRTLSVRTTGFRGVIALDPPPIKRTWKLTASSFEQGEGEPENVLDGDDSTFWHTHWSGRKADPPHSLVVDLGSAKTVGRVLLTQRGGDNHNGRIRDFELYVSNDGQTWGEAVFKGRLGNRDGAQPVLLPSAQSVRFVKLVALSDWSNGGWAALAEFDIAP